MKIIIFQKGIYHITTLEDFEKSNNEVEIDTAPHYSQAEKYEFAAKKHVENTELEGAISSYRQALGIYEQLENHARIAQTLGRLGKIKNKTGDLDGALIPFARCIEIYKVLDSKEIERAEAMYEIANVYHDKGSLDEALDYWKQALPIFQEEGLELKTAKTLRHIGFIYQDKGDSKSLEYFKQTIPLFEKINSAIDLANIHYSIGLVYQAENEISKAITYFEKALQFYKSTVNPYDDAETRYSLCIAYIAKNEKKRALKYYLEALSLYEHNPSLVHKVGSLREMGAEFFSKDELDDALSHDIGTYLAGEQSSNLQKAGAFENVALIYKTKGDLAKAFEYSQQSLKLYEAEKLEKKQAPLLQNLGLISHKMNDLNAALEYYQRAAVIFENHEEYIELTYVNTGIGNIFLSRGRPEKAIVYFQRGLDLYGESQDFLGHASIFTGLGNAYRSKGEFDRALEMYIQALDLFERTSSPMDEASVLYYLGETYFFKREYDVALDKFNRALNIYDNNPNPLDRAKVLTGIGNIHRVKEDLSTAIAIYLEALDIYGEKIIEDKAHTLKNIGEAFILKKKYEEAIKYLIYAMDILNTSPNPMNLAIPLNKLGKIYYAMGKYLKAFMFCAQSVELFAESPNPHDIFRPLQEIYSYEPEKAISLSISSPLGINWYLHTINQKISTGSHLTSDNWYYLWLAVNNWWENVWLHSHEIAEGKSVYQSNWRLKFLLEEVQRRITSETSLNYLFGANDLQSHVDGSSKGLRDAHEQLSPMWFIEIPTKLLHGEQFLKIRLNNLIKPMGVYTSVPSIEQKKNPPVARMKIDFETQWLQKMSVDHLFYPNSEFEHRSFQLNPNSTWLKDVVIMDLGNKLKRENHLELMYSIEVYFNNDSTVPDIKTTSKRLSIPIIRKNNFQEVEKFKENHSNSLAIFIALWSIIFSLIPFLIEYDLSFQLDVSGLILGGLISIVVIAIGLFFLFGRKNKDALLDSIDKSSSTLSFDSEVTKMGKSAIIDLQEIEFDYSVDLQDTNQKLQ